MAVFQGDFSESVPFLKQPTNLDGSLPGDVGFDPLGFSEVFDIKVLREAELKHGRIAMLAVLGWIVQETAPASIHPGFPTVSTHSSRTSHALSMRPSLERAQCPSRSQWLEAVGFAGRNLKQHHTRAALASFTQRLHAHMRSKRDTVRLGVAMPKTPRAYACLC